MHYTNYGDIAKLTSLIRKSKMVTDKIKQAIERYPNLADIVELAAHYEDNHPIHRLCAFVATLTADIMDSAPPQVTTDDES